MTVFGGENMSKCKVFSILLALILGLSACSSVPEETDAYEPVARLYTEILWREIDESDNDTLELCSESVKEKILKTNENAKEMRRKSKTLTKDEVHQLIGNLSEYYQDKLDEFLAMQEMAAFYGDTVLTVDDYEPIMILTKDEYEVVNEGRIFYVVLEDGHKVYCDGVKNYTGEYDIEKVEFNNDIYKYKITLENDKTFYIYLDVKNGKVERLKETEE